MTNHAPGRPIDAAKPGRDAPQADDPARPRVIALVDDDRNILTTVSIALQAEGFATRVYYDGVAALPASLAARSIASLAAHQPGPSSTRGFSLRTVTPFSLRCKRQSMPASRSSPMTA